MTPESTPPTKLCLTCGSKVASDAVRCTICGAELGSGDKPVRTDRQFQPSRIPEVTLSLPAAILLIALAIAIGAVLVFFALRTQPEVLLDPTATNTLTPSPTVTITPTSPPPTSTFTPEPSPTPVTHLVKANETCIGIAIFYGVSVQSIVALNNLPTTCDTLYVNQPLLIPQPTPTVTPLPSATYSLAEQTEAACDKVDYMVQQNDTLGGIASTYGIPMEALRTYNGLPNNSVYIGQPLVIPLCMRFATPGPSPTATLPPPYPAPSLLLPIDGASFAGSDPVILQWASVGTLRNDELYMVMVEDVTTNGESKLVDYVTDSKYILPVSFRPKENAPHILRWKISTVRQISTDAAGKPVFENAGASSTPRVFVWMGGGNAPAETPTP